MFAVPHEKSFFLVFVRSQLITYLITLCLEKELMFWNKSGSLYPKICKNPVHNRKEKLAS